MSTIATKKEVSGALSEHPLAELIAEIHEHEFDGALRLSEAANKAVLYFKNGKVIFAVSNQKKHRLFQLVLESGMIEKNVILKIPDFTNDIALAKTLVDAGFVPEPTVVGMINHQLREIIRESLFWNTGHWTFDPLARVKESVRHRIEVPTILINYARGLRNIQIGRRFNSFNETFSPSANPPSYVSLLPEETFLLAAYDGKERSVSELAADAQMRDHHLIKTIYCLWLGGFLESRSRKSSFTPEQTAMLSAIKASARRISARNAAVFAGDDTAVSAVTGLAQMEKEKREREVSLEVYLRQVENSSNHYDALSVSYTASSEDIKRSYFGLAKRFHPDRFYRQLDPKMMKRVQSAFSQIADAYNTLRRADTRKTYDFKIGKNQEDESGPRFEKPTAKLRAEASDESQKSFDQGFTLLMNKQNAAAVQHFARAVDLSPNVARFHAYYARALGSDNATRFKAETHFQTAISLESNNLSFRMMFAEFLVKQNLNNRAEAELQRLLGIDPNHLDARTLLDSLQK